MNKKEATMEMIQRAATIPLTPRLKWIMRNARSYAIEQKSTYVGIEHLLLAIGLAIKKVKRLS